MEDLGPLVEAMSAATVDGVRLSHWSLYASESRQLSLGVKDRESGNPHAPLTLAERRSARYLIVWNDGQVSRGTLERRQLESDPSETLASARVAAYDDPDAAWVLDPAEFPGVAMYDAHTADLARGDTALLGERLGLVREEVARHGVRTWSASFSASETRATVRTSAGLHGERRGTGVGWFVALNGEVGSGFRARQPEPDADFLARLSRLADLADELAREAEPTAPGVVPVILHPRVVQDYVLSTLLHHLDGSTVAHGESRFLRKDFGGEDPVLREDLGLRVDPLEPMKQGSYSFTVEGLPAAACSYLERGRLVQPVLDLKYSRRLGLPPTPLPYSMDTLHFEGPPALSIDAAFEAASGGALVLSVLGVHTQDSTSGDFSLSAPQVLHLKDGHPAGRLRGTISGNLFDVLCQDELRFVRVPGEHTPGLLFPCRLDPK